MPKPGDLLLGVLNFLAILVPGFVALAVLKADGRAFIGAIFDNLEQLSTAKEVSYFIAAYFVGQIVFLLGSFLDPLYNATRNLLQPADNQSAFECARKIMHGHLKRDAEREAVNPYQWSKAILLVSAPAAADDINRFEADSKFFRSLTVICIAVAATQLGCESSHQLLESLAAAVVCFGGYFYWRTKCTTRAYVHIIALQRSGRIAEEGESPVA